LRRRPRGAKKGGNMSGIRRQYDEEYKKNAVKLSYLSSSSLRQVAKELGVSEGLLYRWRNKYTVEGDKTKSATLEEELKAVRLENAKLKVENDMLKKATAYFANLNK